MSKRANTIRTTFYEITGVIKDESIKEFFPGNIAKTFSAPSKKEAFSLFNRFDEKQFRSIVKVTTLRTCVANHTTVFDPYNEKDKKAEDRINKKIAMKQKLYSLLIEIEELKQKLEKI